MDVPRRPAPHIRLVQRQPRRGAEISVVRFGERRPPLPGHPLPAVSQARHEESPGDADDGGSGGYVQYQDEDHYTPVGAGEQVNSIYLEIRRGGIWPGWFRKCVASCGNPSRAAQSGIGGTVGYIAS